MEAMWAGTGALLQEAQRGGSGEEEDGICICGAAPLTGLPQSHKFMAQQGVSGLWQKDKRAATFQPGAQSLA